MQLVPNYPRYLFDTAFLIRVLKSMAEHSVNDVNNEAKLTI